MSRIQIIPNQIKPKLQSPGPAAPPRSTQHRATTGGGSDTILRRILIRSKQSQVLFSAQKQLRETPRLLPPFERHFFLSFSRSSSCSGSPTETPPRTLVSSKLILLSPDPTLSLSEESVPPPPKKRANQTAAAAAKVVKSRTKENLENQPDPRHPHPDPSSENGPPLLALLGRLSPSPARFPPPPLPPLPPPPLSHLFLPFPFPPPPFLPSPPRTDRPSAKNALRHFLFDLIALLGDFGNFRLDRSE